DAVNGGQLHDVQQGLIGDGIDYAGDSGNGAHTDLGDTLKVEGGATDVASADNIGVEANGDTLTLRLAEDIDLGHDGSVTTGNSVLADDGLKVSDGTNTTDYGPNGVDINGGDITLSDSGLDNGGNTITGVGDGAINSSSGEAINGSQLLAGNNSLANDVLGGDAEYNGDTNSWDMGSDIGGTGKSTID